MILHSLLLKSGASCTADFLKLHVTIADEAQFAAILEYSTAEPEHGSGYNWLKLNPALDLKR